MCVGITSHSARAKGATQEAHLFLIAAFCRLAKSLSHSEQMGWLVGAVGIENKPGWNFKDLEGMLGSAKTLKKNQEESSRILICPSIAPHFFPPTKFLH